MGLVGKLDYVENDCSEKFKKIQNEIERDKSDLKKANNAVDMATKACEALRTEIGSRIAKSRIGGDLFKRRRKRVSNLLLRIDKT